ncbi:hypothetical protein SDC9_178493 [bioreactor metagenome]|uniref:Uncharacterized protein n=1 Tax=bioreactor metagenome TaxID=1076179 RepID=A0A645GY98_9ZZZZ
MIRAKFQQKRDRFQRELLGCVDQQRVGAIRKRAELVPLTVEQCPANGEKLCARQKFVRNLVKAQAILGRENACVTRDLSGNAFFQRIGGKINQVADQFIHL